MTEDEKEGPGHEGLWLSQVPLVLALASCRHQPLNGKSHTFPIFRIWDSYSTAFWLATLGFFVAFLSWFAFAPLMPEAVRADLKLTAQPSDALKYGFVGWYRHRAFDCRSGL